MSDPTLTHPAAGVADPSQPPADPPRALTAAARRRAWTEPRVRRWWLLAAGVLLLTLYVVLTQLAGWWSERRLLTEGSEVQAVVVAASDRLQSISVPDKSMPPDSEATMEFELGGRTHTVKGQLPGHMERGERITTGPKHPVTLRVDPNDPSRWTDRTTPPPLLSRLVLPLSIGLPIVAALGLVALSGRGSASRIWRDGQAAPALVVGPAGQTPFAPRSSAVRCTPADSNDKRVFTVYLPAGAPAVAAGDVVWVVRPPDRPEPAYAAAWFAREGDSLTPPAAPAPPV